MFLLLHSAICFLRLKRPTNQATLNTPYCLLPGIPGIARTISVLCAVLAATASVSSAWPTSKGSVRFSGVKVIKKGETFDGGMRAYQRSDIKCTGQSEGGWKDAVFKLEAGAKLKNAIIGKNQREGVHCDDSDCTVENVWWDDVCEDALSIKGGNKNSVTNVLACGARNADDKVIQHNGYGHVNINGFYGENFGKLYRSCGTCGSIKHTVSLNHVWGYNPKVSLVTVNANAVCQTTTSTNGKEPKVTSKGPSKNCVFNKAKIELY
ncbi:hypothetical protein PHYPSEUDO_003482 [Phytophthora pseudosyringae]|uniref:Probable pectate lyase F n=1 Tax=Phytophthora pseudosyringae TaxID=221518 RepID=A0A8T1VTX0_9STRA|nr:hypothetical protein PHYPSEUDO_003482 [Phytophthora pseudosyringae]